MAKLYFIRAGERGPIKIGYSDDPRARLDSLQVGNHCELELLAAIEYPHDGVAAKQERLLHRTFRTEHIRGEWFEPSLLLLAAIWCLKHSILCEVYPDSEIWIDENKNGSHRSLDADEIRALIAAEGWIDAAQPKRSSQQEIVDDAAA